jgi:hypothetical protein
MDYKFKYLYDINDNDLWVVGFEEVDARRVTWFVYSITDSKVVEISEEAFEDYKPNIVPLCIHEKYDSPIFDLHKSEAAFLIGLASRK